MRRRGRSSYGSDAVVDKDLTAAQIALDTAADRLLLLTDVPAVMRDFGTAEATPVHQLAALHLPPGSMGPKLDACARLTTATGRPSAIGALTDAAAILDGTAGTTITDHAQFSRPPGLPANRLATSGLSHAGRVA